MVALAIFTKQILSRSSDPQRGILLLATAKISSQMMAILRQDFD